MEVKQKRLVLLRKYSIWHSIETTLYHGTNELVPVKTFFIFAVRGLRFSLWSQCCTRSLYTNQFTELDNDLRYRRKQTAHLNCRFQTSIFMYSLRCVACTQGEVFNKHFVFSKIFKEDKI